MAFCNSCGSNMEAAAKFCPKCGAAAPLAAAASTAAPAVAAAGASQGSSALKIILIVVVVVVGLGLVGAGVAGYLVHRVVQRTHVENNNGNVKVETPFGTVESTSDPDEVAHNLGVDIYPGASVVKGSTANVTLGSMHTSSAEFESSDPTGSVAEFYKSKFPNASVTSSDGEHHTIISGLKNNMTTVVIEPKDGKTRIHITQVTGRNITSSTSSSSSD